MLYFTDAFARWEEEHAPLSTSLSDTRSAELYRRAVHVLPGGVNSPVRAMRAIGRDPIFIERAAGAEIIDVDGNTYVDYVCSWGPLILGHAHPAVLDGGRRGRRARDELRRADGGRGRAGRAGRPADAGGRHAAHDVVGHRGVDERDPARARRDRPRDARQVRRRLPRPRRRPARRGGLRPGHAGHPRLARRPGVGHARHRDRALERRGAVRAAFAAARRRRAARRALPGEHGPRPARARASSSCCASWRPSTARCSCSTRSSPASASRAGGAQELTGVLPDLTVMGKVIGGGLPAAAYGGVDRADGADRAGRRRLPGRHAEREPARRRRRPRRRSSCSTRTPTCASPRRREALADGLREAAGDRPVQVEWAPGPADRLLHRGARARLRAAPRPATSRPTARWCRALLARGVYPPPSQFEAWFPSLAHTPEHVDPHARGRRGRVRGDRE